MSQFTIVNAADVARKSHYPGRRYRQGSAIRQALDIQTTLHSGTILVKHDLIECQDKEERARLLCAIASAAKGWQSLQDQIRILRGRPLPGSLKPEPIKRAKRKQADLSPTESLAPKESLSPQDPSPPPQAPAPMDQSFENTGGI